MESSVRCGIMQKKKKKKMLWKTQRKLLELLSEKRCSKFRKIHRKTPAPESRFI